MAEHITSLNEIRENQSGTDAPQWNDLLYAERGTGSDRARAFTVGEIAAAGMEQSFSDDGDIDFEQVQTSAGTAWKGILKQNVDGTKIKNSAIELGAFTAFEWLSNILNQVVVDATGLRIFQPGQDPSVATPVYQLSREGVLEVARFIMVPRPWEQEGDKADATNYRTMTNCESHCSGNKLPTEYLTAVSIPPSGVDASFVLDSTRHEIGEIVLVTNTGVAKDGASTTNVKVYAPWDTSKQTILKEIPPYRSAGRKM